MRPYSIDSRNNFSDKKQRQAYHILDTHSSMSGFFFMQETSPKNTLKRCESAGTLLKRPKSVANGQTQRLAQIQAKFRNLEEDYRKIMQEVKRKNEKYTRQREEVERLKKQTQKEEKEIARLRQLARLTEKKNCGVQTAEEAESSRRKRLDASTGQSELTSSTHHERRSIQKQAKRKEKINYKKLGQKSKVSVIQTCKKSTKQKSGLLKKYKFIPNLNFNNN